MIAFALCVLVVSPAARANDAPEAPEIPEVKTFGALRAQQPIRVEGWDLRFALTDAGEAAGPSALLYCYAEYTGPNADPTLSPAATEGDKALGPLRVQSSWDRMSRLVDGAVQRRALRPSRRALFCQIIPLAWEGTCFVDVLGPPRAERGGRESDVRLRKRIVVTAPRPCQWQPFARGAWSEPDQPMVVRDESYAAVPCFDGMMPLLTDVQLGAEAALRPDVRMDRLPGAVPTDDQWKPLGRLELSARDGAYVVRSSGAKMVDWPDWYLLARWWVNGKPVTPPRRSGPELQKAGRQVRLVDELRVRMALPALLGELKAGDTVALQVLYAPCGFEALPERHTSQASSMATRPPDAARVPLLSNRIEIAVTERLLADRQRR